MVVWGGGEGGVSGLVGVGGGVCVVVAGMVTEGYASKYFTGAC